MKLDEFMIDNNQVRIKSGVTTIQNGILPERTTCVYLPDSIKTIYPLAINCDVYYKGTFISKEEVLKYGCENILRIHFFKVNNIQINEKEVFLQMPLYLDNLKGYIANYKIYQDIKNNLSLKDNSLNNLYKLCYLLGIFKFGGNTLKTCYESILNIYKNNELDVIDEMLNNIICYEFDIKFAKFMVKNHEKLIDLKPYFKELYENFNQIYKIVLKRKELIISNKNTEKLRLLENNQDITSNLLELEQLKKYKKDLTISDVIEYFKNSVFIIREGNEELNKIIPIIKYYITDQKTFDLIQDIYEETINLKNLDEDVFKSVMTNEKGIHYGWLERTDVLNLILGYLVNCCAKVNHAGQEIMRYSMTKPNVRTLVLYNGDKIIGKATAYYNFKEKYLLFNTVELSYQYMFCNETILKGKKDVLKALINGIKFQTKAMEENGYSVNEVRIGMTRNDLSKEIKERFEVEKKELLDNISYGTYVGDASESQAVIERKKR